MAPDFFSGAGKHLALGQTISSRVVDISAVQGKQDRRETKGQFIVRSRQRFGRPALASQKVVVREQQLERVVLFLNKTVSLPQDLYLALEDCGEDDAFYDKETREVNVCHELLDRLQRQFAQETKSPARLRKMVLGTMTAILFHEVAHALIDILNLPATGREEDAADQFASLMLVAQKSDGEQMLLDTAKAWRLAARWSRLHREPIAYWDGHSTEGQRFYNCLCLLYGENPGKFGYLVRNRTLPLDRAIGCSEEFRKTRRSWAVLLTPYLKEGVSLLPTDTDNEGPISYSVPSLR
jgi:hypothetical protein